MGIEWAAGRPNVLQILDLFQAGTERPLTTATVTGFIFDAEKGTQMWTDTLAAYKGAPGASLAVDGVHALDITELNVDSGDDGGSLLEGDLLTLGSLAGLYLVRESLVLSSVGAGKVKITEYGPQPGIIEATAGSEVIAVTANRYRVIVPVSAGLVAKRPVRVLVTTAQSGTAGRFEECVTPG